MENQNPPAKRKKPLLVVVPIVVLVAAFFGIRSYIHHLHFESTDNAQVESRAVPVVSRVAGYIDSLRVDDYGVVTQDSLLIHIDDREFVLAVLQAHADILSAEADLANAQAAYQSGVAGRKVAMANAAVQLTRVDKSKADLARDQALYAEGAVTGKQLDDSRSNAESTEKQYAASLEQVNLASSQLTTADAQVQKAMALIELRKAAEEQANLRLSYCRIVAPVSGKIGRCAVEKGQLIQAGTPLFSIVNDSHFWLIANFKETQLEKMKEGQEVTIQLDGYPDTDIQGIVSSFSEATGAKYALLPPDNATGNFVKVTQRVPVKIEIVDADQYRSILRSGLSATVNVKVN